MTQFQLWDQMLSSAGAENPALGWSVSDGHVSCWVQVLVLVVFLDPLLSDLHRSSADLCESVQTAAVFHREGSGALPGRGKTERPIDRQIQTKNRQIAD